MRLSDGFTFFAGVSSSCAISCDSSTDFSSCSDSSGMSNSAGWASFSLRTLISPRCWCGLVVTAAIALGASHVGAAVYSNWTGAAGNWTDTTKWSSSPNYPNNGTPAGTTYSAVIDAPGSSAYGVTLNSNISVDSLTVNSSNATLMQSANSLNVGGAVALQTGAYQSTGGTLTAGSMNVSALATANLNGGTFRNFEITSGASGAVTLTKGTLDNITLAGPITVATEANLTVKNGLSLDNNTVSLTGYSATFNFSGSQTLGGTGQMVFMGSQSDAVIAPAAGSTLTIGPNITIKTGANGGGTVGGSGALINYGTISNENSGAFITITGSSWSNLGTLKLSTGGLVLGGTTTTAGLGTIQRTGGDLELAGVLNNTGATLSLDQLGTMALRGTIIGGTIVSTTGAQLTPNGNPATLNGVTLAADLYDISQLGSQYTISFANSLTLSNHNIHLNAGTSLVATDASVLGGTGQILIDNVPNGTNGRSTLGGNSVTIGPNVNVRVGTGSSVSTLAIKTVSNQGTISDESAILTTVTNDSKPWSNSGVLKVGTGSLTVSGTWTNTGSITDTGGTLALSGAWTNNGTITATNGTLRLGGAGTGLSGITVSNCNLDVDGTYTTAQIRQIAKTSTSLGVYEYQVGLLDNTNDTLTLSGTNGDFRLVGGTLRGGIIQTTDGHKIVSSAHISVLDGVSVRVNVSSTASSGIWAYGLDNRSAMTFTGSSGLNLLSPWSNTGSISVTSGYLVLNAPPTTQGSITLSSSSCDIWTQLTTAQIRNINSSHGTFSLNDGGVIDNTGDNLVLSQAGNTWSFYGGSIKGGVISSTDGTQLTIARSSGYLFSSLVLDGLTLAANTHFQGDVTPTIQNGLTLSNNATLTFGAVPYGEGHLKSSGTQTLGGTGTLLIDGDRGNLSSLYSDSGTLTLGPGITVRNGTNGGIIGKASAGAITNQGLISSQTASKTVTVNGTLTNQSVMEARNGGVLLFNTPPTNLSGTQFSGGAWRTYANSTMRMVGADIRTNAAEILLDGPNSNIYNAATGTTSALANFATNAAGGTFTVQNGRNFATAGALNNSGTVTVGSASTLTVPGGFNNTVVNSLLSGSGTVGGDVTNGGRIAPGSPFGALAISGNLSNTGRLEFEIGGVSNFDELDLSGAFNAGGTLRVSLTNGYQPASGATFDIMDFNSLTNSGYLFDFSGATLNPGLMWNTNSFNATGQISVVPVPEPCTLLLLWMGGLGGLVFRAKMRANRRPPKGTQ